MALPCLQRVELVLFAAAFLCGALAAATLTRTQVRRREGRGAGRAASGKRPLSDSSRGESRSCRPRAAFGRVGHLHGPAGGCRAPSPGVETVGEALPWSAPERRC